MTCPDSILPTVNSFDLVSLDAKIRIQHIRNVDVILYEQEG